MTEHKNKRGRPEHLTKEQAELAAGKLAYGIRLQLVCNELQVSRQVVYSALTRYGYDKKGVKRA